MDLTSNSSRDDESIFDTFTNKYALSKTLRFELRPVGKTREWMNEHLKYNSELQTFLKDQEIENAYQVLKPVFDKIHEDFITGSLETREAKNLNYIEYFDLYKIYKSEQDKDKKAKLEKELQSKESSLRKEFLSLYNAEGEKFRVLAGKEEKKKGKEEYILKERGFKVLTEVGVLKYIKNNQDTFLSLQLKTRTGNEITKEDLEKALGTTESKGVFEGFFTYFGGFNQNRENYYSVDEKATAVAYRVVNENLPKFCDNVLVFENKKSDYLKIDTFLKKSGIDLKAKGQNGEEIELHKISETIFEIGHFVNCLTQDGIEKYNLEIGNANNLINRYNQQQTDRGDKLKLFKTLYKQIGCGDSGEFIPSIKDFAELKSVLKEVENDSKEYFEKVDDFCAYINENLYAENIYWSDRALNTISAKYFSDWYTLKKNIWGKRDRKGNLKDEEPHVPQAAPLKELFSELDKIECWKDEGVLFKKALFEIGKKTRDLKEKEPTLQEDTKKDIDLAIKKLHYIEQSRRPSEALIGMIFADVEHKKEAFTSLSKDILQIENKEEEDSRQLIKQWLDSILVVNQIVKYWKVKDRFAPEGALAEQVKGIIFSENNPNRFYDIVRNYLTKKPSEELNKLKLNFENSSLADGWDVNKEKDNSCIILKDQQGNKYLVVMKYENTRLFEKKINNSIFFEDDFGWGKMEYKLIPGASKTLPKVLFSKKWIKINPTPTAISAIYSEGSFKKGDKFQLSGLHKLIDFYKEQLKKYPAENNSWQKTFGFEFSDTASYKSIDEFYNEVDTQGYKLEFVQVNKSEIDNLVDTGKIYLFEIKNKDNNLANGEKKEGMKNLHSIYWDAVFLSNDKKPKLNGGAEVFYQPIVHGVLKDKDKNGKEIGASKKRFEREKFVFHCPITLNFGAKSFKLNDEINTVVKNKKELCFLGIDRGEKHLAYYSLVDQYGNILDQGSFNEINGQNYAKKLAEVSGNRDEYRKNWQTIGTIKELKDGYISQVVRKIVDIAIKNNAFIVLENLSVGFKRGRQKIEKQVYQKLELALAKKLNFLVDKSAKEGDVGSVSKALQLTPLVQNFGDIEKRSQFGIMLYTKADYTSQTDPVTGWRKSIYLKRGSEEYVKKQILESFEDIGFDGKDYYFRYTDHVTGKLWTLFSSKNGESLDRYYRDLVYENSDKKWMPKKQDLVQMLDELFDGFEMNTSLLAQLKTKNPNKISERTAWETLRFVIDLIQQIRNTGKDQRDEDYILSPVRDGDGVSGDHFDSRKSDGRLPTSGDANGAYNIARKGTIMSEHIRENLSLFVRDEEWDAWLAGKDTWQKWLSANKEKLKIKGKSKASE